MPWVLPMVVAVEVVLVVTGVIDLKQGLVVALLIEGSLAVLVVAEIWLVVAALRRARARGADTPQALEQAFDGLLPRPLARFARHDLLLVRALWFALRGRRDVRPDETPIRYGKEMRLLMWVLLIVDGGFVALLHFVLPWAAVRTVLLYAGIAATVWVVAFLCTFYVYPHAAGPGRLRLRFAAMHDFSVPMPLVESVRLERRNWTTSSNADVVDDTLTLPMSSTTNVLVTLHSPFEVHIRRRPVRTVRRIAFAADDPQIAHGTIAAHVPPVIP
jgi:hypothetical protein